MTMPVAFVCAPYRAATDADRHDNIQCARDMSIQLWRLGYAVICPHLNTAFFSGVVDEQVFLDGYVEILKRCDLLVFDDADDATQGMSGEIACAVTHDIPALPLSRIMPASEFAL